MPRLAVLPPLSLYIHVPWCVRKCPYCDFNSHAASHGVPEQKYIAALLRDLEHDLPRISGRTIDTIFIGGGTPSLLAPEAIEALLTGVHARTPIGSNAEITLEANPSTVDRERFAGFRAAGINRLSIGVQSFQDDKLSVLGRIHSGENALQAIDAARSAGFENLNLDLMFCLPGQTVQQACADVAQAISLGPTHLSVYQLTLEPGTPFFHRPPELPDDDVQWSMLTELQALLAESGYAQYEISAYSQPGRECRHNRNYWEFGDYLGIGAGAHAKLSETTGISRIWKRKQPEEYLAHAGTDLVIAGERRLMETDLPVEFMMNALRLVAGVNMELFADRTGLTWSSLHDQLSAATRRGMLEQERGRVRATPLGLRFLNDLLELFVPLKSGSRASKA